MDAAKFPPEKRRPNFARAIHTLASDVFFSGSEGFCGLREVPGRAGWGDKVTKHIVTGRYHMVMNSELITRPYRTPTPLSFLVVMNIWWMLAWRWRHRHAGQLLWTTRMTSLSWWRNATNINFWGNTGGGGGAGVYHGNWSLSYWICHGDIIFGKAILNWMEHWIWHLGILSLVWQHLPL